MRALLRLICATAVLAAPQPGPAAGEGALPTPSLAPWVARQLAASPAVAEARARLEEARALERAAGRPLYNPELELDAERTDVDTASVGLSQTVDWADKRGARAQVAAFERAAAEAALEGAAESYAAALLRALAELDGARRLEALARRRLELMGELEAIARRRFEAGDLPRAELELARIAHVSARLARAEAADAVAEAAQALRALTGAPPGRLPPLPEEAPPASAPPGDEALRRALPLLRQRAAELAARRAEAELRRRERRPDPTVQVRGGREESETLVGLTLAVPLFVRNDFRAEVEAAEKARLAAEAALHAALREARARAAAAAERYRLVASAWHGWRAEAVPSLDTQAELLRRMWEAGELGTTEYLVQLAQVLETREAAARLRARLWRAWFEWLEATGAVRAWLGLATSRD